MIVSRHPRTPPGLFVTGSRWSLGIDTRVRSFLDGFGGEVLTGKETQTSRIDTDSIRSAILW